MFNSYDPDEEQFAGLDAFLEILAEKQEEYFSTPKAQILNQNRLKEFQYSLMKITEIIKTNSPSAKITYELNTESYIGLGAINIETDDLSVPNNLMSNFIEVLKFTSNITIYPLLNGNIRISMGFYGMTDNIPLDEN